MTLFRWLLPALLTGLAGCAGPHGGPPELSAFRPDHALEQCDAVFPRGDWQFVHAIDFSLRGGAGGTVLGVTTLTGDRVGTALMSVEGFTLFEATADKNQPPVVLRSVPPFDRPGFAAGLLADVRSLFLPPDGGRTALGLDADRRPVCRHTAPDGRVTDVLPGRDGCWRINTYAADGDPERAVAGRACRSHEGTILPERLQLDGFSPAPYTLYLSLVSAVPLTGQ